MGGRNARLPLLAAWSSPAEEARWLSREEAVARSSQEGEGEVLSLGAAVVG